MGLRALSSVLFAGAALGLLGAATPEPGPVLPPDAGPRLLEALAPLKPGGEIAEGWRLGSITLDHARVEVQLEGAGGRARVLLLPPEAPPEGASLGRTASFSIHLAQQPPGARGLEAATARLSETLRAGDPGDLYRMPPDRPLPEGAAPPEAHAPAIPVAVSLYGGWLLALLGLVGAWRRGPRVPLADLSGAAVLWLATVVYRALVTSGLPIVHENSRLVFEREIMAGALPIGRPMGGHLVVGEGAWLELGALVVPLLYLLARSLGLCRGPALVGAVLAGTLPLMARMGGSEGGFPPAVAHLVAAAWAFWVAHKRGPGPALVLAFVLAALAGVFRPALYVAAAPLGWIVLRHARSPWAWGGVLAWALVASPDLGPILARLGQGSALTPGWWQRSDLHAWPLLDPEVTPLWWVPVGALGLAGALLPMRGAAGPPSPDRRLAATWLLGLTLCSSFLYSSDNGWPASLRYATAYAWPLALGAALGLARVPRPRLAVGAALLLALSPIFSHASWTTRAYAQQAEQLAMVSLLAPLEQAEPGVVLTPWPALDEMAGTLDAMRVRALGHEVRGLRAREEALAEPGPVYWYRGLACWTRPIRGGRSDPELHAACAELERSAPWRPVVERDLEARSDSDWILVGPGEGTVTVGLYRRP